MEMHRAILWLGLCVVLAIAFSAGAVADQQADQKAMALFEQGVKSYDAGELEKAKQAFDELLALKPSSLAALDMRRKAELGLFVEMLDKEDVGLAGSAKKMLELMTTAVRQKKREVTDVDRLLTDFQSPAAGPFLEARTRLIGHGPYAVPYLLDFLTRQGPKNQRIVARTISTLTEMHRDVCLPLTAALSTDDEILKVRIVTVLGHLGDARAVPALLAVWEADTPAPVVEAAYEAIKNITARDAKSIGPAVLRYTKLIEKYLAEDATSVGYVFGDLAEVWTWEPGREKLQDRLTYELVPAYLYYQRQGAQCALEALRVDPDDGRLQALLVALLCRELRLVRDYAGLGGEEVSSDAQARLADLQKRLPVVCHIYGADTVGEALERLIALKDSGAALGLVELLAEKVGVGPSKGADALLVALATPYKDVRYRAAVAIVELSPTGQIGDPGEVMQVLSAALKHASVKTALLVFNDLQIRNRLNAAVGEQRLSAVECTVQAGAVDRALNLEPAVDIVFVGGNVSEDAFGTVLQKLKTDARTKAVPLYVIADPRMESPDLSKYEGIAAVLSPDDIRAAKLQPLLETVMALRPTPIGAEKGEIVLLAARALLSVDPEMTGYPLRMLEPSLIGALRGFGEPVQLAAVGNLARFGSASALEPLAELLASGTNSEELKASACYAIAAVAQRTGQKPSGGVVSALKNALDGDVQTVKEAAAEALSVAGLSEQDILGVVDAYALPGR